LHALARLGAENILALTGDAQKEAFAGKAKPVHDLDSVLILRLVRALRDGLEYSVGAKTLRTAPFHFFAGAVVNPFKTREPDLMMQLCKLRLKVAAGAQFVITQIGFNLRKLHELKLYLERQGMGHIPVLANVYVPTGKIARMMQSGEIAGCRVTEEFVRRLENEKKAQRLERAALMVAAVKELGFAGAHIGGFGLVHGDFQMIMQRAGTIGSEWRARMDELAFASPGDFYLFRESSDGLSDGGSEYQTSAANVRASIVQQISESVYQHFIKNGSLGAHFFGPRLKAAKGDSRNFWARMLAPATLYRKATLGCVGCGDCLQDHLNYAGCSMRRCYKELRNGPCGGSRVDGNCEARPELPCVWNMIYQGTLAMGDEPEKFAHMLIPPRDWSLDRTNALVNRFAEVDNLPKRRRLDNEVKQEQETQRC
jgi:methylenetetrahydrofolate reductase (NADPH)